VIDLRIDKLIDGKPVYINNTQQRAENWVKVDNIQVFTTYGVDYQSLLFGDLKFEDINLATLQVKIATDLANNNMICEVVVLPQADSPEITIQIKVI
jgi:hypothetical protein